MHLFVGGGGHDICRWASQWRWWNHRARTSYYFIVGHPRAEWSRLRPLFIETTTLTNQHYTLPPEAVSLGTSALLHREHICVFWLHASFNAVYQQPGPNLGRQGGVVGRGRGEAVFPFSLSLSVPQIYLPLCINIKGRKTKPASSETTKCTPHAAMRARIRAPCLLSHLVWFQYTKIHASCCPIIGLSTANTRRKKHTRARSKQHITPSNGDTCSSDPGERSVH